ncbi:MAG: hypothetical protein WD181_03705 [Solirubrobacterales bacterium]
MLLGITANTMLFGSAAAVSLVAFVGLILIPSFSAYGRWPEKIAAGFLSLFIFGALVTVGIIAGLAYVFFSNDISGIFPWSTG